MKILLSSDFHSNFSNLFEYASIADLCICCGDVFDYHKGPLPEFKFPLPFYCIKGNKELWGGAKSLNMLNKSSNFFWLNEHLDLLCEQTGLKFLGLDHLQTPSVLSTDLDVLISHEPAYGIADQCNDAFRVKMVPHCGSKLVRTIYEKIVPKFLISGHVHHFQYTKTEKSIIVTLAPALTDPVILLDTDKKVLKNISNNSIL